MQQPAGVMRANGAGDAVTRGAADAGAGLLDGDHQRIAEQHGPADGEPERGARLRIGADAARVVVRRPGDEAWPERVEDAFVKGWLWLMAVRDAVPPRLVQNHRAAFVRTRDAD